MTGPTLTTARLTLRRPEEADFGAFAAFAARARAHFVGGPGSRQDAREAFDENLAHWAEHGCGYFHAEETATGVAIGRVGIRRAAQRPEPELAFSLYEDRFEGRGYAREAALAVRDWARAALGLVSVVSYVDPANTRSRRLAEALGAVEDGVAPRWGEHPDLLVYRHPAGEAAP